MKDKLIKKFVDRMMAFVNTKGVTAIKDGIVFSMPLLIVGSIFLILANLPVPALATMLETSGITPVLNQAIGATFNISAIVTVIGIAYTYAKLEKQEPLGAGVIALAVFLLIQPSSLISKNGDVVGNIILKDWTSGKGMIGAIIVGLIVGASYSWFLKKNIKIKMPDGVPTGVANAFSALIPATVIITAATIFVGLVEQLFKFTTIEVIYNLIQTPMQGLTDSLFGAVLMCFLVPFLWMFGVHGSTVVGGIMSGLLQANALENQAILDKGLELNLANGGHIVTIQFFDQFINVTGAGITIGLVVYMIAFAKSKQLKILGRLEMVPAIFNINEPVLFGLPIVMNPVLAIPFILTPILSCIIQYSAIYFGLTPMYGAVQVPWTCPPIISGFIIGGWKTALLQTLILVMSFFVYYPFIKQMDKQDLQAEIQETSDLEDEDCKRGIKMDEKVLEVCFQIITYVGTAKSMYIDAIQLARQGEFEQAKDRIKQGEEAFVQGHNAHHSLLTKDMNGELSQTGLLLMHAEDQLMSAEGFRTIAEEFIAVYKRFEEGK